MKITVCASRRICGAACALAFAWLSLACFARPAAAQVTPPQQLYWSQYIYDAPGDRFSLHRSNLDGTGPVELNRSVLPEPWLGLTVYDGKLLWGAAGDVIHAVTLAGEELGQWDAPLPPAARAEALGLAYDASTGTTFRAVSGVAGDQNIERLDSAGNPSLLIPTELFVANLALALDPVNRKLYFGGYGDGRGVIRRANLDGTGVEDVVANLPLEQRPFDLALDPLGGKMYWTADFIGTRGTIRRANLDGTGVEDLHTGFAPGLIALDVVVPEPAAALILPLLSLALLRRHRGS